MYVSANITSVDEMEKYCNERTHILYRNYQGRVIKLKINGRVRRWKRDRSRILVPVKYGMYEYGYLYASDMANIMKEEKE